MEGAAAYFLYALRYCQCAADVLVVFKGLRSYDTQSGGKLKGMDMQMGYGMDTYCTQGLGKRQTLYRMGVCHVCSHTDHKAFVGYAVVLDTAVSEVDTAETALLHAVLYHGEGCVGQLTGYYQGVCFVFVVAEQYGQVVTELHVYFLDCL